MAEQRVSLGTHSGAKGVEQHGEPKDREVRSRVFGVVGVSSHRGARRYDGDTLAEW